MRVKQSHRILLISLTLASAVTSTTSLAECQSAKPATVADVARGQSDALLKAMVAACKSQEPSRFFELQTTDASRLVSSIPSAERGKLFDQYCTFTNEAVKGLGGNLATAVHTVGPHKNRRKCGVLWSYWFVHNKAGEMVLRLEVALESGRLKIDTH